jgi:hypothetical protein
MTGSRNAYKIRKPFGEAATRMTGKTGGQYMKADSVGGRWMDQKTDPTLEGSGLKPISGRVSTFLKSNEINLPKFNFAGCVCRQIHRPQRVRTKERH